MIRSKPPKPKTCKVCFNTFTPFTNLLRAKVCSPTCAQSLALSVRAKEEKRDAIKQRKADRERKEKLKTRSEHLKDAQRGFNRYIVLRDAGLGCISCGRDHQGQWHAGHYLSVGSRPELRFSEANVHKQCAPCNTYLSGNLVLYRAGLVAKIGIEAVEELEGPCPPAHLSIDDLKAIKTKYRQMANELEKQR